MHKILDKPRPVDYYKEQACIRLLLIIAAVVELADTRDLKSLGSNTVPVQARSAAPKPQGRKSLGLYLLLLHYSLFTKIAFGALEVKSNSEK